MGIYDDRHKDGRDEEDNHKCLCGEVISIHEEACPACLVDMDLVHDILDERFNK